MTYDLSAITSFLKPTKKVTKENVLEMHSLKPKRFCFNSTFHANSLSEVNYDNGVRWALFLKFDNTIKDIFEKETGLKISQTKRGEYWCPIKKQTNYDNALAFREKHKQTVFLRDALPLSVAISEYQTSDEEAKRTAIGELEYKAKYQSCSDSLSKLAKIAKTFITNTPFYQEADYICAVPSSNPKKANLPNKIANIITRGNDSLSNISDALRWAGEKGEVKELGYAEKWDELQKTDIEVDINLKGKTVILLDDMYQSGITMQFVAMKLQEAGASKVYGLALVKARKDTDNK
jgi:hypothetical protein